MSHEMQRKNSTRNAEPESYLAADLLYKQLADAALQEIAESIDLAAVLAEIVVVTDGVRAYEAEAREAIDLKDALADLVAAAEGQIDHADTKGVESPNSGTDLPPDVPAAGSAPSRGRSLSRRVTRSSSRAPRKYADKNPGAGVRSLPVSRNAGTVARRTDRENAVTARSVNDASSMFVVHNSDENARWALDEVLASFRSTSPTPAKTRLHSYVETAAEKALKEIAESAMSRKVEPAVHRARLDWFTEPGHLQRWAALLAAIEGGSALRRFRLALGNDDDLASPVWGRYFNDRVIRKVNMVGIPLPKVEPYEPVHWQACNARHSVLTGSIFPDASTFGGTDFSGADLRMANLAGVDFGNDGKLLNADLRGANLTRAKFAVIHTDGMLWDTSTMLDPERADELLYFSRRGADGVFTVRIPGARTLVPSS